MSSDRNITERLPWYLNGTLEAAELAEVEQRLAESEEERDELADTEAAARIFGHRLPAEVIVAYVFDGGHPEVPTDLLERYLAVSPVARDEVELVRRSKEALDRESEGGEVVPFARAAAPAISGWRRLALAASIVGVAALGFALWQLEDARQGERRIAEMEEQLRQALAAEAPPTEGDARLRSRLEALEEENSRLAAGKSDLVEQVEQQDERIERMGEQIAELTEPLVNIPVVDVWPGDMVLRGETGEDRVVVVPRQTRTVALILNSNVDAEQEVTGLRILGDDDAVVWTSPVEPRRDELGTFTVALPVRELEAGRYTLELLHEDGGETRVVESYTVEIR